ncbi:MAG: hypothetical protein RMH75_02235 [Archaeoglobaceae archaeon]|nr:hypothetical protein [Archaeoglobaceae archaeon]MDW7989476.1 hypothetical protein [Archaeoglobaceae archaeon]
MIYLLEPIKKVVIEDIAYVGKEVKEKYFGGFCECGGMMFQKIWLDIEKTKILISECEKCWKNSAYFFNSYRFTKKEEVRVVEKIGFTEYLRSFLSDLEIEALIGKARDRSYKPSDLSRAKKKLNDMNISIEELIGVLK